MPIRSLFFGTVQRVSLVTVYSDVQAVLLLTVCLYFLETSRVCAVAPFTLCAVHVAFTNSGIDSWQSISDHSLHTQGKWLLPRVSDTLNTLDYIYDRGQFVCPPGTAPPGETADRTYHPPQPPTGALACLSLSPPKGAPHTSPLQRAATTSQLDMSINPPAFRMS
jgi:hypothetical protein